MLESLVSKKFGVLDVPRVNSQRWENLVSYTTFPKCRLVGYQRSVYDETNLPDRVEYTYQIWCGLNKLDWRIIRNMLEIIVQGAAIEVFIYSLDSRKGTQSTKPVESPIVFSSNTRLVRDERIQRGGSFNVKIVVVLEVQFTPLSNSLDSILQLSGKT